jgi:hypothetical protein
MKSFVALKMDSEIEGWISTKLKSARQYYPVIDSRYYEHQEVFVVFVAFRGSKKGLLRKKVPDFHMPSLDKDCYSQEVQNKVIQLCFRLPWTSNAVQDIPSPPGM